MVRVYGRHWHNKMSRRHTGGFHIRLVPPQRSLPFFSLLLPVEFLIFSPICWRTMERRRRSGERKLGKREFRELDDARLRLGNLVVIKCKACTRALSLAQLSLTLARRPLLFLSFSLLLGFQTAFFCSPITNSIPTDRSGIRTSARRARFVPCGSLS